MQSLLTINTLARNFRHGNLRQKKLKNAGISSALFCFFLIPTGYALEDTPPPPQPGEKTQSSAVQESPPPALPKERTSSTKPAEEKSILETRPPVAVKETGPASDDSRNIPEPEVNIIHRKDTTIEEYRINGRLRYVKITPKVGKPYYLVDKDGDGELESRHNDLDGIPPIAEWILLKW